MLPTVAYIGGPAEIAYFAQSQVLYRTLLGRMPVALPRAGYTILDSRSEKLMERYQLGLHDFFHGETPLRERVASRLVPGKLADTVHTTTTTVESAIGRLRAELAAFDPTLAQALDRSARKIAYQIQKMERKTAREAMRRDRRAAQDADSLCGLIFPERHLQERLYGILPFLAKHGLDLPGHVYDSIELRMYRPPRHGDLTGDSIVTLWGVPARNQRRSRVGATFPGVRRPARDHGHIDSMQR